MLQMAAVDRVTGHITSLIQYFSFWARVIASSALLYFTQPHLPSAIGALKN
jgi:hypothetical protein